MLFPASGLVIRVPNAFTPLSPTQDNDNDNAKDTLSRDPRSARLSAIMGTSQGHSQGHSQSHGVIRGQSGRVASLAAADRALQRAQDSRELHSYPEALRLSRDSPALATQCFASGALIHIHDTVWSIHPVVHALSFFCASSAY